MSIILSSVGPDRARINEHANHYNTDAVPPALTHVIHMTIVDCDLNHKKKYGTIIS
jgi:hypothetical protein